jgi:hypothetical protein
VIHQDFYWAEKVMEARVAEALRWQEMWHLQRLSRGRPQEGPARRARRLLGRVALLLVTLGGRLVQYGLPPHCPLVCGMERGNPSATVA